MAIPRISVGGTDEMSPGTIKAVFAEFLATFLFIGIGVGTAVGSGFSFIDANLDPQRIVQISLAFGLAIAVFASGFGAISGGHMNPAVTFGFVVAGKMSVFKGVLYALAQSFGAILAVFFIKFVTPASQQGLLGANGLAKGVLPVSALLLEAFGTFILVWTVFATAVDKRGPSAIAPFIIGLAVLINILFLVPYDGASINPARTLGSSVVSGNFDNHWVFWAGPLIGGGLAGFIYTAFFLDESEGSDLREPLLD